MYLTFRGACVGFATVLVLGCGSSQPATNYPDAQDFDAGTPDSTTGGVDARADVVKPLPISGGDNVLLYGGRVAMLSGGPACTQESGATGDRWCAFTSDSKTGLGSVDLFVINVSRAAAGVSIACGGGVVDPNCLKMTGGFAEDPTHTALFQGDTLVYFDETGTPYGWRPGMLNGRVLASATADIHDCFAAPKGTAVLCLRRLNDLSTASVEQSELLVGRLDSPTDPPLVKVDTVISSNTADGNQQHFQDGFPTPAGDMVAWSSRATLTGPEILKIQKVGEPGTLRTVASDVASWNVSPDGTQWYWLTAVDSMTGAGALVSAPLPDGVSPTTLQTGIVSYSVAATGGLAIVTSTGALRGIADPKGAPTTVTPVDTGVIGIIRVSTQGHVVYVKSFDQILRLVDLHVRKLDGTGMPCTLSSRQESPIFATFLPGSGAILWARFTNLNVPIGDPVPTDGLLTSLADCKSMIIASGINNLSAAGDNGVLFANDGDGTDATLRVRSVAGGSKLGTDAPTLIQTRVDNFTTVFPSPGAVLFTVNAASASDGLYFHLIAPGSAGPDGGSDDSAGDASIAGDAPHE